MLLTLRKRIQEGLRIRPQHIWDHLEAGSIQMFWQLFRRIEEVISGVHLFIHVLMHSFHGCVFG